MYLLDSMSNFLSVFRTTIIWFKVVIFMELQQEHWLGI